MSSCKHHIKTFKNNALACFFDGFLSNAPCTPHFLSEEGGVGARLKAEG
jgi:hypothetical protein